METEWGPAVESGSASTPKRLGSYRIERELGAGAMGTVFLAYDENMKRSVALKVLPPHMALSPTGADRFDNEAWIAGRLDHPNIVKVFARGTAGGVAYFSMELLDGGSLHGIIDTLRRTRRYEPLGLEFGGRGYTEWAVRQVIAASRAMEHAHRHGVIHRDIKPQNILLSAEHRTLKIADFGLAVGEDSLRLTRADAVVGTLAYMAPEQLNGKRELQGPASDVYALGVTLFELLTLELPYRGESAEMYKSAVLTSSPRRAKSLNQSVGRDLETVIGAALEKDPSDRYASAGELADDLEAVLEYRPIRRRPPGPAERVWKWGRRKPLHAALVALLVVGVPTLGVLGRSALTLQRKQLHDQVETRWSTVRILFQQQRYQEVISEANDLLALDPRHVQALRSRAIALLELGLQDETALGRQLKIDGALADLAAIAKILPGESWPSKLGDYVRERAAGGTGFRSTAEPDASRPVEKMSPDELSLAAFLALERKDAAAAVTLMTERLSRAPSDPEAYSLRGDAYLALGKLDDAIADYRVAVGLSPNRFHSLLLAKALNKANKLEDAEAMLRRVLGQDPADDLALETLSDTLLSKGRAAVSSGDTMSAARELVEAEQAARKALAKNGSLVWATVNLGASLSERNRLLDRPDPELLAEAQTCFAHALARWPHVPAGGDDRDVYVGALTNSCDALTQQKELQRALDVCSRVIGFNPTAPAGFYNLAAVYALLGRRDDALSALENDVKLGDTDAGYLKGDKAFESLRGDPRFAALLEKMKPTKR